MLKSNTQFDVVILEQFVNDALKSFAYHYKAPMVLLAPSGSNLWINNLITNPAPLSYIPERFIDFKLHKFINRLYNHIVYLYLKIYRNLIFFNKQNKILLKYFLGAPHLHKLLYNAFLALVNSDLSTSKAIPRVPIMKDIGGIHHHASPKNCLLIFKPFLIIHQKV